MKDNSTLIVMILDRSGSMDLIRDATIEGMNGFIVDQRKVPGKCLVTLVQFDNEFQTDYKNVPLSYVEPLTRKTFIPRGATALLDAVGNTIDSVGRDLAALPDSEKPNKVIFVIQTDGQENASREFDRRSVFDRITHQREKYAWEFIFLGANIDAVDFGTSLGISAGASIQYTSTTAGTQNVYGSVTRAVTNSRLGNALAFDDKDRLAADTDDKSSGST